LPNPALYQTPEHRTRVLLVALGIVLLGLGGSHYWSHYPRVSLTVDGTTRQIRSDADTVQDLLKNEKLVLSPLDLVSPPLFTRLSQDLPVQVTRVTTKVEKVVLNIPIEITWKTQTRQNLRRVRIQKGILNQRRQTVLITYYDGKEASRVVTQTLTVRKPLYQLSLLDNQDRVEKNYAIREAQKFSMLATGYYIGDPMVPSDTTYMGHKLQRGLVAVDPSIISLGSRLFIPGYGYAYASDTGSAIKGLRIDLAVKDRKEELRYNHRQVTVYVLEKTKTW